MAVNFKNKTLSAYLNQLSKKEPVPGGGSAAALTASLGAGLVSMVTNYSMGRKNNTRATEQRLAKILKTSEGIRQRCLELTSLDSEAYLKIVAARKLDPKAQRKASKEAAAIGKEVCKLCYQAMELTPFLVSNGNPYLVSDIEVAVELLEAAFKSSMVMVRINQ
jgi:methenyltetrahydrofolate cyclohydrolase